MDKKKILIVDDDANIAELISLYLLKECYDTRIVGDGEAALKEFARLAKIDKNVVRHLITVDKD